MARRRGGAPHVAFTSSIATGCADFYTRYQPFWESVLAIPPYTTTAALDAVPHAGQRAEDAVLIGPSPISSGDRWTSWLHLNHRMAQVAVDLAMIATVVLTFAHTVLPADVMFHIVFVLLTVHAFLFGLHGTLLRIAIVSLPLLAFANAWRFGWDQPPFDLNEWPLMFVIAVLVAWMADRRDATARRYASLFRQASERLLTVEEDERRRIALELHDGVGQVLTALTLTLDAAGGALGADATTRSLGSARKLAETALAEVRHLAHRMRPARIEERGLVAAVRDLASQSGFPVVVHANKATADPKLLGATATVEVFRIIQEALANAAQHSGAPRAQVSITRHDQRLTVVVADDGRGFDPAEVPEAGIGLAGMLERSRLLGGQLSIESASQGGTRVTVSLPIAPSVSAG
jgi:two-component system, NarL family, sensor histidine kinase UhpB